MKINDYDFDVYNKRSLEHISRHMEGSKTIGSKFYKKVFPSVESIVLCALNYLEDYDGQKIEKVIDYKKIIGTNSLVNLNELPEDIKITKGVRGVNEGYVVNLVEGALPKEEFKMAIVAGPTEDKSHAFYTIYPGIITPPFPLTEEKIKEEVSKGKKLKEVLDLNEISLKFWNSHGFIK